VRIWGLWWRGRSSVGWGLDALKALAFSVLGGFGDLKVYEEWY
jgi:hypothetical protein